jgi:catechol 2,3-dioxygenase-like lactoylglutathione lyase family enzyme
MKTQMVSTALFSLAVAITTPISSTQIDAATSVPNITSPILINTCLITNDIRVLTAFYSEILGMEPHKEGDNYAEFRTGTGVLALFAAEAQEKYIPGSAKPGQNKSAILEFRVANVDQEYTRLQKSVKAWVKGPTTQPWGTRSIYFRDPDGNLVDFFAPIR